MQVTCCSACGDIQPLAVVLALLSKATQKTKDPTDNKTKKYVIMICMRWDFGDFNK
jgi:hypothetical protein